MKTFQQQTYPDIPLSELFPKYPLSTNIFMTVCVI